LKKLPTKKTQKINLIEKIIEICWQSTCYSRSDSKTNFNYFRIGVMKKVLLLVIPVILILAGCSQSDLEPTSPSMAIQKSIIQLPPSSTLNVEDGIGVSEVIEGSQGGMLKLNETYNSQSGQVSIKAKLKIPKDAFSGTETLSFQINSDASIDFYPGMTFDKDCLYDIKFTGLDLTGIDPNDIGFYYLAPDNTVYPVSYSHLTVDVEKGILEVKDAIITHFSRYIWTR
jgi:hypothetical protein